MVLSNPIAAEPLLQYSRCSLDPCHWLAHTGALTWKALARYQIILLGEQRHSGVNNLPKVVAQQCSGRELNPQPLDHKSELLTTTSPSHQSALIIHNKQYTKVCFKHGAMSHQAINKVNYMLVLINYFITHHCCPPLPLSPFSAGILNHISSHFLIPLPDSSLTCTVAKQRLISDIVIVTIC